MLAGGDCSAQGSSHELPSKANTQHGLVRSNEFTTQFYFWCKPIPDAFVIPRTPGSTQENNQIKIIGVRKVNLYVGRLERFLWDNKEFGDFKAVMFEPAA
jgi:hypothetical protein